jgi:hypothetical protein
LVEILIVSGFVQAVSPSLGQMNFFVWNFHCVHIEILVGPGIGGRTHNLLFPRKWWHIGISKRDEVRKEKRTRKSQESKDRKTLSKTRESSHSNGHPCTQQSSPYLVSRRSFLAICHCRSLYMTSSAIFSSQ